MLLTIKNVDLIRYCARRSATARTLLLIYGQNSIFHRAASNLFARLRQQIGTVIAPIPNQSFKCPSRAKELYMKRILFVLLTLGLFSAALAGCHAEGDIDTASSISLAR